MKIIKENTVYQLTFLGSLFPINCYLVEELDGLTLIDAAIPSSAKGILEAAEKIGKPITRILLTHAHDDHLGALDAIKNALPNVPVFVSKREARLMSSDRSLDPGEPNMPIVGGVPKKLKTRADVLLKDGDMIESLRAIAIPGHTPGSMAYLDTRNNSIIVGDAMQTKGGIAVAGVMKITFPFPAMATWNKKGAIESARKLLEYKPSLLAAGHGKMIKQPEEAIKKAILQAENKLKNRNGGEGLCHQE